MRQVLLKDVPRPPHLDFRDQHDEARRFGAGMTFQRLLRARLPRQKDLLRRKAPSCQPRAAEANFELCSGSAFCVQKSDVRNWRLARRRRVLSNFSAGLLDHVLIDLSSG